MSNATQVFSFPEGKLLDFLASFAVQCKSSRRQMAARPPDAPRPEDTDFTDGVDND
jgi:hypothetical protein